MVPFLFIRVVLYKEIYRCRYIVATVGVFLSRITVILEIIAIAQVELQLVFGQ